MIDVQGHKLYEVDIEHEVLDHPWNSYIFKKDISAYKAYRCKRCLSHIICFKNKICLYLLTSPDGSVGGYDYKNISSAADDKTVNKSCTFEPNRSFPLKYIQIYKNESLASQHNIILSKIRNMKNYA